MPRIECKRRVAFDLDLASAATGQLGEPFGGESVRDRRVRVLLRAHPAVADVRVLGATAVIETHGSEALAGVAAFARARGVWLRPIGRWLYTMPAYIATDAEITQITGVMKAWFLEARR